MPQKFFTQALIKISGRQVSEEFMDALIEVVVDSSLYLPDMFTIKLRDYELKWVDDTSLDLGKPVKIEIEAGEDLGNYKDLLIEGEIAALEPSFSVDGDTTLLIRGYDKSHRLHRGKKTRTFLKQTDSAIVQKIAGEVGLSPQVDATSIRYDFVMQTNQTNMEFLQARAARLGYQVYADGQKLYFKKGDAVLGQGPTLKFQEGLDTFRPSLAATHQPDKMVVKGWDSKGKKAIKSEVQPNSSLNQGGMTKTGGAAAARAFGGAETVVVDQPVFTVDEADALAKGLANDISREFIRAEGTCLGNPNIKAGWTVKIQNVGRRFSGKYFVTAVTHIYNETGYNTHFSITGRQPDTVSHLLESSNGHHKDSGHIQGVAIGLVTNLNDPEKLGRIKVKYPWLGDDIESDWARIATPNAGNNRGFFYLPEVNDEVLLAFQHGNPHHPYIIGYLWNSKDKPPQPQGWPVAGGGVDQRIIQSRSGHYFIFDDTQGQEKITVQSKNGHQVILDDGNKKISIVDETGSNKMEIDSGPNTITIDAVKDLTLKCGNKLTLECTELAVTAKAKGSIKANANLDLESTGPTSVKGATVSVNGNATTEVKGGAMVQIQGALVKIN